MCDLVTKVSIDFIVKVDVNQWESEENIIFTNDEYHFVDADFISDAGNNDVIVKITGVYYLAGDCIDRFKENWAWHGNCVDTDILIGGESVEIISDDSFEIKLES